MKNYFKTILIKNNYVIILRPIGSGNGGGASRTTNGSGVHGLGAV